MEAFKLDVSGEVQSLLPTPARALRWSDLSPFAQGYVEAMAWSVAPENMDAPAPCYCFGFSDLSPEALARIIEDCERYRGRISATCRGVGALFWKNRSAGYLSDDGWNALTPTLADDGLIYFKEQA